MTMKTDPRIDDYIAAAAPFAQPILAELRARVHASCPELEETLKWSSPAFVYRGKLLGVMAAFKQHAAFNLWQGAKVVDEDTAAREGMGQFGKLLTVADLPSQVEMKRWLRKAMALIEAGEGRGGTRSAQPKAALEAPGDLLAALAAKPAAQSHFSAFSPAKRREYIEWVIEAKRAETRAKRIEQAVEWIAEGKARHWKYERC